MELVKPTGWVYISLSGNDPRYVSGLSFFAGTENS